MQYGLLGKSLKHSFSPQIHAYFYDTPYALFEVEPQDFDAFMTSNRFDAINVTIPYKKEVLPYCATLSDTAKKIGSVNTVVRMPSGKLHGDNSDYYGFLYLINKTGVSVQNKKAVVLGSGGACLTVCQVLRDLKAASVVVISRSGENNYETISKHYDCDILVNTTPVGMYPNTGTSLVRLEEFKQLRVVIDLIYNPAKTKLLLDAESLNIPAYNGLSMLIAQAKKSAEVFTGAAIPDAEIEKIEHILSMQTKNILLIGMPGCGKSTVGKVLAKKLNRPFQDTDKWIEEQTNRHPAEILQTEGEAAFRKTETAALETISKQSGLVIATGGGIVTQPNNYNLVKQNSIVFFIDRPIEELETKNRPLSQQAGLAALYQQRIALYLKFADYRIPSSDIEENANRIKEILEL